MIDWIQVLLGQPLEEEREEELEELKWTAGQLSARRRTAQQSEKTVETAVDETRTDSERSHCHKSALRIYPAFHAHIGEYL